MAGARPVCGRVECGGGVPEDPLIDEAAREVPDRGGDHPARTGDPPHRLERAAGSGHEIQRQLRKRAVEARRGKVEGGGVAGDKAQPRVGRARGGVGDVRLGDVDADDRGGLRPGGERQGEAAGAAADVEHSLAGAEPGPGDQPIGQ